MERDQHTVATWERKRGAHLSLAERGAIQSLSGLGLSLRQIALQIKCSPATVMYELRRGTPRKTGTRGRPPGTGRSWDRRRIRLIASVAASAPASRSAGAFSNG